ncbi:YrhK family protein [Alteromonas pelagimontana]|uniref:YrhK family protein n=1 Tax=Alteromonas pelagimontana TaxID=1858656 RepID=A0A6M4MDU9_9ALTE|nr:YrhK family protein [Alteromonas pelagimontana]QJR81282.1 YrhK family protein [Alteromonas pelagimontana]
MKDLLFGKQNLLNGINILASLAFFFGSALFLPRFAQYATVGVWLFMTGSLLMFVVSVCGCIRSRQASQSGG